MAGIYIHIPFCKQKCHYCNFFSLASKKLQNDFIPALVEEIRLQKTYLDAEKIETIYFGGGTPSLLTISELSLILETISQHYSLGGDIEVTLEANPDDIDAAKLKDLMLLNINRLSLGIQSFFDDDLQYLNRVHDGGQSIECIRLSKEQGFENLSVDIIYGMPTLTQKKWESNLEIIQTFDIQHFSAYWLTIEPKTALAYLTRTGKVQIADEERGIEQLRFLQQWIKDHGYTQYEISNFCKGSQYSRHNISYWQGKSYLGVGPSAHSYNGTSRQWNVSNISTYLNAISHEEIPCTRENLLTDQLYNEYIMTSLRTIWGCDLSYLKKNFGIHYFTHCMEMSQIHFRSSYLKSEGGKLFLTETGILYADSIISDLFIVEVDLTDL